LNQKLETEAKAKDAEIQAQAAKIEDLQQSVAELKALVGKLANK